MKNSKKIVSLSLAATMLASSGAAFAMPDSTIVIGDKAFDIMALSNDSLYDEIDAAIAATSPDKVFYSIDGETDGFVQLSNEEVKMTDEEKAALTNVAYTDKDGNTSTYEKFDDKDPVAKWAIASASATNGKLTVVLSGANETAPVASDFTATVKVDAADAAATTLTNFAWDAATKTATMDFPEVAGKDAEQTVVVAVTFAEVAKEATYKVPVVTDLAVESVSAINSKTLGLTFSRELTAEEKAAATFVAKKDGLNIVMNSTVVWDGAVAQLTKADDTKLAGGDYTVTVSGVEATTASATATVVAETVANVELVGTDLVKTGTDTATISYKAYNQYGEDITATTAVSGLTATSSKGTATPSLVTLADGTTKVGKITVDKGSAWADTDTSVVVTLAHNATGTTTSATLTLQDVAAVSAFEITGFELPVTTPATTRIYTGSATAATLTFTGADQYGNEISTYGDINSNITFVSSDPNVVITKTDVDGGTTASKAAKLTVDTSLLSTAKTVSITAIVNATGATSKIDLEIVKTSDSDAVTITAPTTTVASADAVNTFVMDLGVTDQFGEAYTAQQIVDNATDFTISSSNAAVIDATDLTIVTTGDNKGKIVNTGGVIGAKGTAVITVTVNATGKSSAQTITVEDAAHVNTMQLLGTPASELIQGATTKLGYKFVDQYGRDMTLTGDDAAYKVVLSEVKVSGDSDILTTSPVEGDVTDESGIDTATDVTVTAATTKTGSAKLRAQLVRLSDSEVISQVETAFNVVANTGTGLTYAVEAIPTLDGSNVAVVDGSSKYAYPVTVTATDASGNTYAIPSNKIFAVESSDVAVVKPSAARLDDVAIDRQDYNWVVDGEDITGATTPDTQTATITVFINTDSGVKTATTDVTVAKAAPKTEEVVVVDTVITAGNPYEYVTDTKELTTFEYANRAAAKNGTTAYAYKKDQYGVYSAIDLTNATSLVNVDSDKYVTVSNDHGFEMNNAAGGTFALVDTTNAVDYRADSPFKLLVNDGTDATVYKELTITITAEELPTITALAAYAADVITVTASEELNAITATDVVVEGDTAGTFAGTEVTLVPTTDYTAALKAGGADDNTIEVTLTAAGKAKVAASATTKFRVTVGSTVTDYAGNAVNSSTDEATTGAIAAY